jgi:hypothetical protein
MNNEIENMIIDNILSNDDFRFDYKKIDKIVKESILLIDKDYIKRYLLSIKFNVNL